MNWKWNPDRRRSTVLGAAALAVAALSALTACGASAGGSGASGATLRVGYIADVHGAGLVTTAQKEGFFSKEGVNAETMKFSSGPNEIEAIAAGKLDIAYIGPGALWAPMAGKADVIAIDSLSAADALVANPAKVPDLKALKGKKIGYPKGTSGQMILDLALTKAGLSPSQVDLVPMDQNLIPTAYLSGQIDVAVPFPPGVEQILQKSKSSKIIVSDQSFAPQYTFPEVWIASPSLVKQHPQEVEAFLKAFILSNDWRRTHLSQVVANAAQDAGTPPAGQQFLSGRTTWLSSAQILADNKSGAAAKWYAGLNALFVKTGQAKAAVSPSSYDNTALYAAAYSAVAKK